MSIPHFNTAQEYEDWLEHYGVKGMRWGERKAARPAGTPRSTERAAAKDAKEAARAKMYYGEGAGVRRRLINNTVKSRMVDPKYKEAYERNLANQDMGKRASEARSKRARTDTVNGVRKTTRGIINAASGKMRYASAASIGIVTVAAAAHRAGVDRMAYNYAKTTVKQAASSDAAKAFRDIFG
jgi:hypothetical protein